MDEDDILYEEKYKRDTLKIGLDLELVNTEMECVACGLIYLLNKNNIENKELINFQIENSVFRKHECPNCGCNTFDTNCFAKLVVK